MRESVLKGKGIEEFFHGPLKDVSTLATTEIKTEKRSWTCEGFTGKTDEDGTVFTTETRTNNDAPFGVVSYRYEKERQRNNQPQGKRTMEWLLVEFGEDATSAAPNAK